MPHTTLECIECKAAYAGDMDTLVCKVCESPLEVSYGTVGVALVGQQLSRSTGSPIPLPFHKSAHLVSLGEGNTPMVELPAIGRLLGLARLYAKLEFVNPTGSFKDRGAAVMMSVAKEHGVTEVVEDSSGNAGASVSAYAARGGIKAHIFLPSHAPVAKIQQIRVYGAHIHFVDGPREAAAEAAAAYSRERGLVYSAHNLSPYFIDGMRTFAYELIREFPQDLPEHVVMPVGNGSLYIGSWKGFEEHRDAGRIRAMPRMHLVQSRTVMPLVAAYRGERWVRDPEERTIAGGISIEAPPRKRQCLNVLEASQGVALAVDDTHVLRWQRLLAEEEGIYAEPTAAAAFAGIEQLVDSAVIHAAESVLVPVTGFGLKDASPQADSSLN